MKKIILALILVVTFFSCSDEAEPITFLEKHNMSVWERKDNSEQVQKFFMRISSDPNKIAVRWYTTVPDHECYSKHLYGNGFEVGTGDNTLDYLEIVQKTEYDDQDKVTFNIINGELIQAGYTINAHGSYRWAHTWVKSKVDVDDLNLCD